MAAGAIRGSLNVQESQPALRSGAVNILDSTVIAVSSTAPAYSLAASMAGMVAAVGFTSPLVVLLAFLPVLGIAIAFLYLNRVNPNCGASFTWISGAIHPAVGFISAWASLMAGLLFMVSASSLAGTYTTNLLNQLGMLSEARVADQILIAAIGACWFALVTFMVVYGIQAAARFQWVLLSLEYLIVLAFAGIGLFKAYGSNPPKGSVHISAEWFSLANIGGLSAFANGAVIAVFFFWGWDTAANVNEESDNAAVTPGRAGVISMFFLLFIFLVGVCALQSILPAKQINDNSSDVLAFFGTALVPKPWNYLMTLAVLSSAVATLQTTLLPATRTTLSMARESVFPGAFSRIHPRFLTPWIGTLIIAGLVFLGILLSVQSPSIGTFLSDSVLQVGVLVSVYYSLTGFACAWFFRHALLRSIKTFIFAGVFALGGGVFIGALAIYNVYNTISGSSDGWSIERPVLVSLALGLPVLLLAWLLNPAFFRRPATAYDPRSGLI